MATIKIYVGEGVDWLYGTHEEWKDYVCEDFNQNVVCYGNKYMTAITEAKWWRVAYELMGDFDMFGYDDWDEDDYNYWNGKGIKHDQVDKAYKIYEDCNTYDDVNVMVKVLRVLYPNMQFETATLRGYSQSDWQDAVYVADKVNVDVLENYYMGKVTEVVCDDECCAVLTDEELWNLEMENGLETKFRDIFDLDDEEPITILKADGYIRSIKWKEM